MYLKLCEIKGLLEKISKSIISGIANPPEGKSVTSITFTYDADKDLSTLVFKEGAETLFTLTFNYDADKNLISIVRS